MRRWLKPFLGLVLVAAFVQRAPAGPAQTAPAGPAPPASAGPAAPTPAGPSLAALAEINYLLDYLGNSGCEFYRNGAWYDSAVAKRHLRYKYDALAGHGQITTAEDFIGKAATKSSLSGIAYRVRCAGGPERPSGEWLQEALATYRAKGGQHGETPQR